VVVQQVVSLETELPHYGVELVDQTLHTWGVEGVGVGVVRYIEVMRGVGCDEIEGSMRGVMVENMRECGDVCDDREGLIKGWVWSEVR
jgi:hypothetical protein